MTVSSTAQAGGVPDGALAAAGLCRAVRGLGTGIILEVHLAAGESSVILTAPTLYLY